MGSGANSGTKMTARRPRPAAAPASEEAALPVEAQATTRARRAAARATPIALARSLNEAVGLRPSSLSEQRAHAGPLGQARARAAIGVQPTGAGGRGAPSGTGSSSR